MDHRQPRPAPDADPAQWIAPRLTGDIGTVGGTVPSGYDAYVRIFHPVGGNGPTPVPWSVVAAANGRTMHALAQFHSISTAPRGRRAVMPLPGIGEPDVGALDPESLRTLCDILTPYTADATHCYFGVWEGHGGLGGNRSSSSVAFATIGEPAPLPREAPHEWQLDLTGPTFELPFRVYHLFEGALPEALTIGEWVHEDWFLPQPPNLMWPADQAWCVATEIDFDSTLVGGSGELIADLLHSTLEAWPVQLGDALTYDADEVNQP